MKAQTNLSICTGSSEPSLIVYTKYGSRNRAQVQNQNSSHTLGRCRCSFKGLFYANATRIIQLLGHCFTTWYAMSRSLVKLTGIGTGRGVSRQCPIVE